MVPSWTPYPICGPAGSWHGAPDSEPASPRPASLVASTRHFFGGWDETWLPPVARIGSSSCCLLPCSERLGRLATRGIRRRTTAVRGRGGRRSPVTGFGGLVGDTTPRKHGRNTGCHHCRRGPSPMSGKAKPVWIAERVKPAVARTFPESKPRKNPVGELDRNKQARGGHGRAGLS
jgi:hypothetical protein